MKKVLRILFIVIGVIASIIAAQLLIKQIYQHRKSKYVDLDWEAASKPWEE